MPEVNCGEVAVKFGKERRKIRLRASLKVSFMR